MQQLPNGLFVPEQKPDGRKAIEDRYLWAWNTTQGDFDGEPRARVIVELMRQDAALNR